jgi:hypothetical protein
MKKTGRMDGKIKKYLIFMKTVYCRNVVKGVFEKFLKKKRVVQSKTVL